MKKALVVRTGAYGDMLIVSPLFRALKKLGYHVILNTGNRGVQVLKNNPYIDEYIVYKKEGTDDPDIEKYWTELEKEVNPDWFRNLAESIEVNISLHPRSPVYIYPKKERYARGNRNFYEVTAGIAGVEFDHYYPDVFIDKEEEQAVKKYLKPDKFNILWCLSGSGSNKCYPWVDYVIGECLKNIDNLHFIMVGNERCQLLETLEDENITHLSGKVDYRTSIILTKLCDLVVSPDTGVLHASGAFDTPKIGILGHTTIENITKHFKNDYSLNAISEFAECAPCFKLIYNSKIQCPLDNLTGACWCMSHGQPPQRLYNQIVRVINEHGK